MAKKTERELDNDVLHAFARGKDIHDPQKRARLAYMAEAILRERGIATRGLDDRALAARAAMECKK